MTRTDLPLAPGYLRSSTARVFALHTLCNRSPLTSATARAAYERPLLYFQSPLGQSESDSITLSPGFQYVASKPSTF